MALGLGLVLGLWLVLVGLVVLASLGWIVLAVFASLGWVGTRLLRARGRRGPDAWHHHEGC